ncbi:MAG TPA: hypothetical protein VD738_02350 [Nitrospira sp.]|nr:hypothetical protein [Nitrospira sp.]
MALSLLVTAASVTGGTIPSAAIEAHPTRQQIRAALARGQETARQQGRPDTFYVRFGGTDGRQAGGFLLTKLGSLSVLATHMALRGREPSEAEITQVVEASTMLVSGLIFGDQPSFAVDSYMVLDQGGKTITPVTVRFDGQADRSAMWPDSPRYKAKVVASFNYADFNPAGNTIITVFPANGGAVSFTVDFSEIE